ncbi:MAG TPA: peptidoglycan-binding domain-containing protein [Acidimicrobiales bacterium]
MEWLIALTGIALVAYWFGVPSRHTRRIADHMAAGAAGGARRATNRYFRRRDLYWLGGLLLAGLIFLIVIFDDDETPASATETAEAAPTTETISSPLSFGDTGPDVVIVQERLAAVGLPVTADGVYGQETVDAVMAFQEQEQLVVDGVVGSATGEALGIWSG